MIEQLRRDIAELNEDIQEWQGEIEYLEEKIKAEEMMFLNH